jgi:hypothetical protein
MVDFVFGGASTFTMEFGVMRPSPPTVSDPENANPGRSAYCAGPGALSCFVPVPRGRLVTIASLS